MTDMITIPRSELKEAYVALQYRKDVCPQWWEERDEKIKETIRARLAQPELEQLGEIVPADEEQLNRIAKLVQPEPVSIADKLEPVAWMYVEGLDALKAGKCWTAYGTKQDDDCRFPLYTAPPPCQTCEALARTVMMDQMGKA